MGNSACLSPAEVSSHPLPSLNLTHEEDDFVMSLFQQRIPINEIGKVTGLDQYKVLGSGMVPTASAKPEIQELALLCLQGSQHKLLEKHADVRAALMGEIKYLGGSDNTPEVQFNKSRIQILCRIYDALLREEERDKRRRLAHTHSSELSPSKPAKDSLPVLSRVGISFTLNLLMATVETVGIDRPQLLLRTIDISAELISELKPLSLVSVGESIRRSVDAVMSLFRRIISGDYPGMDKSRHYKAVTVLLGLALARGDLRAVLELSLQLLTAEEGEEWTDALATIAPMLGNLREVKPKGLAMKWTWNSSRTGPDIVVTNGGLTITRTSSSGWGCNLSEQTVSSGVHYIEFHIDRSDSTALLLGLAAKSFQALHGNCSVNDVICYQADGDCYAHGNGEGNLGGFGAGDRIGLLVDMEEHTVIFFRNGTRMPREIIRGVPEEVALIVCFGGGDQFVSLVPEPTIPPEYEPQVQSVPLLLPSPDFSLFPTNVHLVLDDSVFDAFTRLEVRGDEKPIEATAFLLANLDVMGEGVFGVFRLDTIKPKFPKHTTLVKTYGLAVDVQESTFQSLLSLLEFLQRIFQKRSWLHSDFKTIVWAALSALRLLRNHVFAAKLLSLPDSESGLNASRKQEIHSTLNFYSKITLEAIGLDPSDDHQTAIEALNSTAALVTIHSFELFYPTLNSQLDFVLAGLTTEKQDEKRLVAEVLKKVSLPMSLVQAFDTSVQENRERVGRFLETVLEITTKQSMDLMKGEGKLDESLMTTLYVAQGVLLARLAKTSMSEDCLPLFQSFFTHYLANVNQLLQTAKEISGGKVSDEFEGRIKKTILGSHMISLLRGMSLLQFDAEYSAKMILEMINLTARLGSFSGGRWEHVRGVTTVKQNFESGHPYPDNADLKYTIEVPGAVYYTLTFDPQCKSERNYDYLELWTDEDRSSRLYRWEGDAWPTEPIVVRQRSLHFTFHSDQTSNFWGWKIEVAARVQIAMTKESWVEELRNCCTVLLVALCQGLILVGEKGDRGVQNLLVNKLMRAGIKDAGIFRITREKQLVQTAFKDLISNTRMDDRLPVPPTSTGLLQLTVFKSLLPKRLVTRPALSEYLPQLQASDSPLTRYCDIVAIDELISGSERAVRAFNELKRQAKAAGPHSSLGGEEMDQAERAIFAVLLVFFEQADVFHSVMDTPQEVCEMLKYMVKQTCKVRQWAQIHRQKLINESNAQISYADLGKEIVDKCVILLHTDYRQTMAEIGIEKALKSLAVSSVQKAKSSDNSPLKPASMARLRSGSKWMTVKKAVATMRRLKTLQELRNIGRKAEPEDEQHADIVEFHKVYDLIIEVLASPVQSGRVLEELKARRNRAVARTVGLQILYRTSKAAPLMSKGEIQGIISGAFSEAFLAEGRKQHFTEGTEGVDPYLNSCLRRSFFQLYQLLLERLQVNAVSELDCTSSSVFHYLMHTLDALNFPFEDQDAYSLLDLRIRESVNLLLNWSKGQRIFQHIPMVFDTSKTITDFKVHKEAEYRPSASKEAFSLHPKNRLDGEVADEVEGQQKLSLEVIRGPYPVDLLPISDVLLAANSAVLEGYTKINGNVNEIGDELCLFVKREKPKEGGQYLVRAAVVGWNPVQFEFNYKPFDAFLIEYTSEDDKEQRKTRKLLLKRGAWLLFKMLTYTAAGKSDDQQSLTKPNNRFKLQELFTELIFGELKWLPQQGETEKSLSLRKLLSGKNWRNSEIPLIELKTNPVVEWVEKIREDSNEFLFRAAAAGEEVSPFEVSLIDNVNDYISSTDPCLQGVLEFDDLPEGLADIPEEYFNTKKQVDFFCFLRHIVAHIDTAVSPFWAKNVKSSPLYQNLPIDFYEATQRSGEGNIASILNVFLATISRRDGDSFGRYLEMFGSAETPGVIPAKKIPEGTPNEFLNEERQLDFFTAVKAIRENEVKFSAYFREIKPLMRSYSVLPPSCSGFYKVRLSASQMEYQASLLLVIYQCCNFQGMLKVLSKSAHLLELLKHMLMGSLKSSTISFRIVREIIATQHSPESFAGIWSSLPKGKLKAEYGADATKEFVVTLFTFVGVQTLMHAKSWKHGYMTLRKVQSLSHEALDFLLLISKSERWGRHIISGCLKLISNAASRNSPEWGYEALVGALVYLKSFRENQDRSIREWSKVELKGAGVSQATLVKYEDEGDTVKVYCEADDALHKEKKESITRPISEFSFPLFNKLPSDLIASLFSALISLFLHLPALPPDSSSSESRVYISTIHRAIQCYALDILSVIIESKHDLPGDAVPPFISSLLHGMDSEPREFSVQVYNHLRQSLFSRYRAKMTNLLKSVVQDSKSTAVFTEEEEAKIIGKYTDDQQLLVAMLKSMGFGFGHIKEAIDTGCSNTAAVLKLLAAKHKERKAEGGKDDTPLLYKLNRNERNLAVLRDPSGKATARETASGHLILTAREEIQEGKMMLKRMEENMFGSEDSPPEELTILVRVGLRGETRPVTFGVVIGRISLKVEVTKEMVETGTAKRDWGFRVFAKFTGRVQVVEEGTDAVVLESEDGFSFEDVSETKFGIFLQSAGEVELKGFSIFLRHYTFSPNYWSEDPLEPPSFQGRLINFEIKPMNTTETALASILGVPLSVSSLLSASHSDLKEAIRVVLADRVEPTDLTSNYGGYVQDCVVVGRLEDVPTEYSPAKLYINNTESEDYSHYTGPIFAVKTSTVRGNAFVKWIDWKADCFEVRKEDKGAGVPLVSILVLRVDDLKQISVPHGFRLLTSAGKAVNLTPDSTDIHFLAYSSQFSIRGFPFTDLTQMGKKTSDAGLIDSFEVQIVETPHEMDRKRLIEELAKFSTLSVVQLQSRLANMERGYIANAAFQLVLKLMKRWSQSVREISQFDRLLEHSGNSFAELAPAVTALLRDERTAGGIAQALGVDIVAQLCKGTMVALSGETRSKAIVYESAHPYENNTDKKEEIRIPGAKKLTFTFDPQCKSENTYDYLLIAKDKEMETIVCKHTGSAWGNFEVDGDSVFMWFHSDVSNNEWGYKFVVTGVLPGDETTSDGVKRGLWLLETLISPEFSLLPPNLSQLLINSLTLFAHTTTDPDHSLRAFSLLKKLLKSAPDISTNSKSIVTLIAQETAALYSGEAAKQKKSELLITAIGLVTELKEKFEIELGEEWFRGFYESYCFLRGFVEKNEDFQFRLLMQFLEESGKSFDVIRESAHPYSPAFTTREVHIPGASSIDVHLSSESESCPTHGLLFSKDLSSAHPLLLPSIPLSPSSDFLWNPDLKGPDIQILDSGKSVTRTSSSGWGCAILNSPFKSGTIRVGLSIDAHDDSSYLYLGVIQECAYPLTSCINKDLEQCLWTYKATGELHRKGFSCELPNAKYSSGDEIAIRIDFDEHTVSFYKNKAEVHTFSEPFGPVTVIACFGGNNQRVSLAYIEQHQSDPLKLSDYRISVPGDRFYYHFPVNAGYISMLYAAWKVEKHPLLLFSNKDKTVSRRVDSDSSLISVFTTGVMKAGRHFLEIKFANIGCSTTVSFGICVTGLGEFIVEYLNNGTVRKHSESLSLEGFKSGDSVALLLNIEESDVRVFKNGIQISQTIRIALDPGKEYRWVLGCTGDLTAEILKLSPLVDSIDLIGRGTPSPTASGLKFGYKFTASPVYMGKQKRLVFDTLGPLDAEWQGYFKAQRSLFSTEVCEQLVNYIDEVTMKTEKDPIALQAEDINPSQQELLHFSLLEKLKVEDLRSVFRLIREMNVCATNMLPLISLELREANHSLNEIQRTFLTLRGSLFLRRKQTMLRDFLSKTHTSDRPIIEINRTRATRQKEKGMVDTQGVSSIFGQVYRRMNTAANRSLRSEERIVQVNFVGEGSIDAGGPYNEVMSSVCEELQSKYLPLLVQCPNGVHNLGDNRDTWIPNPAADSQLHSDMFLFLGKLLGVAIRTKHSLNLSLAPLFWKRLIFEPVTLTDLKSFDECIYQTLDILRHMEEQGITSDNFELAFGGETFTTVDSSSRTVELTPGGKDLYVVYRNARDYADLLEKQRLTEAAMAYSAIRQGISAVVPLNLLYLFSWKQVETLVCGAADINVEILRSKTVYEGFDASSEVIALFWEVLKELSAKDRTLFLRFVWGRSKLPPGNDFKQFKITRKVVSGNPDQYLPISHTCFFTLDLPVYTSKEVLRDKLVYAITHCQAIDLDRVAGAEGWEEEV